MISFQQMRRFFVTMSFAVMLTIAFDFGSSDGLAATLPIQLIGTPLTQIATMNRVETAMKNLGNKVQAETGNATGDSKAQVAKKAKQFDATTQERIGNSIENPDYQPGGKTKQAEMQDREVTDDLKAQVHDNFKNN